MNLRWYLDRGRAMDGTELYRRARDEVRRRRWRRRWAQGRSGTGRDFAVLSPRFATPFSSPPAPAVPPAAARRLRAAADELLAGRWPVFASWRDDMAPAPDWFFDPISGTRLPQGRYCFDIDLRGNETGPALKPLFELSRHHHTTVLAAAYLLSGEDRYAVAAAGQLRSWWDANPFLSGVHWTSAIEVGMRLVSWVWVRRLLNPWPGAGALFEDNPEFLLQLHRHQEYLSAFPSHGSSANNHLLAEVAGQFIASCAFPCFDETARWRAHAATVLEQEVVRQTFPCGLNRELATAYHAFAFELCLAAALEGDAAGHPLPDDVWDVLRRMADAAAAMVDTRLRPPRQGDDDEGVALLVDAPGSPRWPSLLATGETLFGRAAWWPEVPHDDVRTPLWGAMTGRRRWAAPARPAPRPDLAEAGMAILRAGDGEELWCRCDHGAHGYLTIAAHAHADALAVEMRIGGVDILADPGTYCYHGDPPWRSFFRSTLAHNTFEVAGADQSVPGGPFLWNRHATTRLEHLSGLEDGPVAEWQATHDGYSRLPAPVLHRRAVRLDRRNRRVEIQDSLETAARHDCRLAFHLGPAVACSLHETYATLWWAAAGEQRMAFVALPPQLTWRTVSGAEDPPLGWYSPRFGVRQPAVTLVGSGAAGGDEVLRTVLLLPGDGASERSNRS